MPKHGSEIFRDDDRKILSLTNLGDSVGNSVEANANDSDGGVFIEIDEPWAGDTETGFGRTGRITLPHDAARALGLWLMDMTIEEK